MQETIEKPQLRKYQVEVAKKILDKKKLIIADDMSMGKCAEAIGSKIVLESILGKDIPALITSPASVIQQWQSEIKKWYHKKNAKVSVIQTESYNEDTRKAENSDFTIIGYPTLSALGSQRNQIEKLEKLAFEFGVIDEAHNAKNPQSIRSMAAKHLYDSMDYLLIMSGTPIPNSVADIYMLLSLLDKETFPINPENSRAILTAFYTMFRRDPEFVRNLLNERMVRRKVEDYLQSQFPNLVQNTEEISLEGEHKETYESLYENYRIKPGCKLIQLVKASIDPNLVRLCDLPEKLASRRGYMESSVYSHIDALVDNITENNGKVLLFSNLKKGVTENLKERYKKFGAVVIDSSIPSTMIDGKMSMRESIRRKFQNNKDCKVLISTTVMDEGVDLTAASDVIHLTLPYTPANFDQRNRRSQRIGEVHKQETRVHIIKPVIKELPVITLGIEQLLKDKKRIISYILEQPTSITNQDLEQLRRRPENSHHLVNLVKSPSQFIGRHLAMLRGQGFTGVESHYQKYPQEARYLAQLYSNYWEGYPSGNNATFYTKIIKILEEKEKLEKKIDLASGPFSLSRRLHEPVINLDINKNMLDAGKILERDGKIVSGNNAVQGYLHQLPFSDNSFDFALCSNALYMTKISLSYRGEEIREREDSLRESNRVLRQGGKYLITIPHTLIRDEDLDSLNEAFLRLGFRVLPFSGFYRGPGNSRFKVYLAALEKISQPQHELLDNCLLSMHMDRHLMTSRKRSRKERKYQLPPPPREDSPEILNDFYTSRTREPLEDYVRERLR